MFAEAAVERLGDAEALLREMRYHGAVYMAGYAVECALKAALCRHRMETYLAAEQQSHNLEAYAAQMGFRHSMPRKAAIWEAWQLVTENWSVDMRYRPAKGDERLSKRTVDAASELLIWINGQFIGGRR